MGSSGKDVLLPAVQQPSMYSLTLDEFQIAMGKDLGPMNMDEFLKSVWNAEELMVTPSLPRTLSQKTVDEVWRDLSSFEQEPNLGEMTLEEFLMRAAAAGGDAGEENFNRSTATPQSMVSNSSRSNNNNNNSRGFHFGLSPNNGPDSLPNNNNYYSASNLASSLRPYTAPLSLGNPVDLPSPQETHEARVNGGLVPGLAGLGGARVMVAAGRGSLVSPELIVNKVRKCSASVEKVVERRQRRMIKNRESAARSRARKQAYTVELEAEVASLKNQNDELQKKQIGIVETQKNQVLEMIHQQLGPKERCLRRTHTGPW